MNTKPPPDPRNTNSRLGQAYWQHHRRVIAETQPKIMGHVTTSVLDGIESFSTSNPNSVVAGMREEMLRALGPDIPAGDPGTVARFSDLYKNASNLVFSSDRGLSDGLPRPQRILIEPQPLLDRSRHLASRRP